VRARGAADAELASAAVAVAVRPASPLGTRAAPGPPGAPLTKAQIAAASAMARRRALSHDEEAAETSDLITNAINLISGMFGRGPAAKKSSAASAAAAAAASAADASSQQPQSAAGAVLGRVGSAPLLAAAGGVGGNGGGAAAGSGASSLPASPGTARAGVGTGKTLLSGGEDGTLHVWCVRCAHVSACVRCVFSARMVCAHALGWSLLLTWHAVIVFCACRPPGAWAPLPARASSRRTTAQWCGYTPTHAQRDAHFAMRFVLVASCACAPTHAHAPACPSLPDSLTRPLCRSSVCSCALSARGVLAARRARRVRLR
jgi:hypothetical protein